LTRKEAGDALILSIPKEWKFKEELIEKKKRKTQKEKKIREKNDK